MKSFFILLIAIGGLFTLKDKIRLFNPIDYFNSISHFVSLDGRDEYIIATLQTSESYNDTVCVHEAFGKCILPTTVTVEPEVFYKYFIKLGDLKYSISGDTLIFTVPKLYLSTPVPVNLTTIDQKCNSTIPNLNCQSVFNRLMDYISDSLEKKGEKQKPSVYEKAAKTLADNFNRFIINNGEEIWYKNISVTFVDEGSKSVHIFKYNESYCGHEKCNAEIDLWKNSRLFIK